MSLFIQTANFDGSTNTRMFRRYYPTNRQPHVFNGKQRFETHNDREIRLSLLGFHFPMIIIKILEGEVTIFADDEQTKKELNVEEELVFRGFQFLLKK